VGSGYKGLERWRAVGLRCGLLAAALALVLACERLEPGGTDRSDAPLAERRDAAARRGIEWLFARKDAMGPDWAFATFSYLYPVVRDPTLAKRCLASLAESSRVPIAELPAEFRDPELLRLPRLRPIVAELLRRKRAGEPHEEAVLALEALLLQHQEEFWRSAPLLQQLTFLHSFSVLGIESQRSFDDVVQEIRARWARGDPERLLGDARFMLALTHVFYTASGYMTRHPDPAAFGPEIEMLRRALRRYLSGSVPPQRHFLDIQAEVLFALELLRVPEDDDMRAMAERLLELQNADGSWGEDAGNHREHATLVAVQALIDHPDAFRRP
jgi:hypothetical protein